MLLFTFLPAADKTLQVQVESCPLPTGLGWQGVGAYHAAASPPAAKWLVPSPTLFYSDRHIHSPPSLLRLCCL